MSEKIKAIRGSKERFRDVKSWLIDNGALNPDEYSYELECYLYYVKPDGYVSLINSEYEYLFDEEELPRWRAKHGEEYYAINSLMGIDKYYDLYKNLNNEHWRIGNYFKTEEETAEYINKFKNLLKERK